MRPLSALHSTGTLLSKIPSTRLKVKDETLGKTHINSARSAPQQSQVPTSLQIKCVQKTVKRQPDFVLWIELIKTSVGMSRARLCLPQRRGMLFYYLKPQQCRMLMKFLLCCTDQIIHRYCLQKVVVSAKHLLFYPLALLPKAILVFWPAINLISEGIIEFLLLAVPFPMSLMKRTFFTIKKGKITSFFSWLKCVKRLK